MNYKNILILLLGLISLNTFSQSKNIISGKINVPLIVDEVNIEDHFLDDRRDSNTKKENVTFQIYTDLKNTPIYFTNSGKSFQGSLYENKYNVVTELLIQGKINPDSMLGSITIKQKQTKNVKSGVCDYDYIYSYTYEYKNLNVRKQLPIGSKQKNATTMFFFTPKKDTKLAIKSFKYIEDTKCPKRNYSKEIIKKRINQKYLNEKLSSNWAYFRFNVNWDGRTFRDIIEESTTVTKLRGEVKDWNPPSSQFSKNNREFEPNSIAIYFDYTDFDETLKKSIRNTLILEESELGKNSVVKVLNRDHLNNLLFEYKLSDSGLVKEESIIENKLMKEEIAIIIKPDINKKLITCNIASKSKNLEIKTGNYIPSETSSYINFFFTNYIIYELNEQFKN
jgi:hypothetical protein